MVNRRGGVNPLVLGLVLVIIVLSFVFWMYAITLGTPTKVTVVEKWTYVTSSGKNVYTHYMIKGSDGTIYEIQDFLFTMQTWAGLVIGQSYLVNVWGINVPVIQWYYQCRVVRLV